MIVGYSRFAFPWHPKATPSGGFPGWSAIAYSPSLDRLVAGSGATTSTFMTSDDGGETWTLRAGPGAAEILGIAWSPALNLFVAVGFSAGNLVTAFSSADGITWTAHNTAGVAAGWQAVTWAPSAAVFCATSFLSSDTITSADGLAWTRHAAVTLPRPSGITWAPSLSLFVAVADAGAQAAATSANGIAWTLRNTPFAAGQAWEDVCWSADLSLFVAVSSTNTGQDVMTSPDGAAWTARTTPNSGQGWWAVASGTGATKFAAVANSNVRLDGMTSANGIAWTAEATPDSLAQSWEAVCFDSTRGRFVAVSSSNSGYDVMVYP